MHSTTRTWLSCPRRRQTSASCQRVRASIDFHPGCSTFPNSYISPASNTSIFFQLAKGTTAAAAIANRTKAAVASGTPPFDSTNFTCVRTIPSDGEGILHQVRLRRPTRAPLQSLLCGDDNVEQTAQHPHETDASTAIATADNKDELQEASGNNYCTKHERFFASQKCRHLYRHGDLLDVHDSMSTEGASTRYIDLHGQYLVNAISTYHREYAEDYDNHVERQWETS